MAFTKVTNTGIGSTGTVLLQNLDVIGIATAGFGVSTVDVFTTGITTFANATDCQCLPTPSSMDIDRRIDRMMVKANDCMIM